MTDPIREQIMEEISAQLEAAFTRSMDTSRNGTMEPGELDSILESVRLRYPAYPHARFQSVVWQALERRMADVSRRQAEVAEHADEITNHLLEREMGVE